jgi:hypothetical protein
MAIDLDDSDGDGYPSRAEIGADRFWGNAGDDPPGDLSPRRICTRVQLDGMTRHSPGSADERLLLRSCPLAKMSILMYI